MQSIASGKVVWRNGAERRRSIQCAQVGVAEALIDQPSDWQSSHVSARDFAVVYGGTLLESIYKGMDDFSEKALWKQILKTSEMRMTASRHTNALVFDRMEETRKAIRSSQETIRKTDDFIRRVMPISK